MRWGHWEELERVKGLHDQDTWFKYMKPSKKKKIYKIKMTRQFSTPLQKKSE